MFERYTEEARRAIFFARREAQLHGADAIDTMHLLLGICFDHKNRANELFHLKKSYGKLRSTLYPFTQPAHASSRELPLDMSAKIALARTAEAADQASQNWIDSCHLLVGVLRENQCAGAQQLSAIGITLEQVLQGMQEHPADFDPVSGKSRWFKHFQNMTPLEYGVLVILIAAIAWVFMRN